MDYLIMAIQKSNQYFTAKNFGKTEDAEKKLKDLLEFIANAPEEEREKILEKMINK